MSNDRRRDLIHRVATAIRTYGTATDELDDAAAAYLGINRTDGRCLDILDQRGPITAGELAAATGLSTGAITAVLDRLESAGYARRVRDEHDRRCVRVELTEEARRRIMEVYGPLAEEGYARLGALSDKQLVVIRDFMDAGRELLAEHAARVRQMAEQRPHPSTVSDAPSG